MVNWPGHGADRIVRGAQRQRHRVTGFARSCRHYVAGRAIGSGGTAAVPRAPGWRHCRSPGPLRFARSVRSAFTSSVMSMPAGHQTMHRPQPTQPEEPNWSCQVPSLWVSHCRYRLAPDAHAAAVQVGEVKFEAGVPALPALGVLAGQIGDVLDGGAEAGRAGHRAVAAGQAPGRHVVPAGRSWLAASSSRRPPACIWRPIWSAAAATAPRRLHVSLAGSRAGHLPARIPRPLASRLDDELVPGFATSSVRTRS